MTEQAEPSTQRALEPRSAEGAAVGQMGEESGKEGCGADGTVIPASLWLERRHEEG